MSVWVLIVLVIGAHDAVLLGVNRLIRIGMIIKRYLPRVSITYILRNFQISVGIMLHSYLLVFGNILVLFASSRNRVAIIGAMGLLFERGDHERLLLELVAGMTASISVVGARIVVPVPHVGVFQLRSRVHRTRITQGRKSSLRILVGLICSIYAT